VHYSKALQRGKESTSIQPNPTNSLTMHRLQHARNATLLTHATRCTHSPHVTRAASKHTKHQLQQHTSTHKNATTHIQPHTHLYSNQI